ncbi:hypothetical protein [Endozoicomonas elysicola]|uniref:hypothetical protein n=1 Tax=Endozoicomonas elysicola TaxID=305900 RepID=UPI0012678D39|nr:hypothetical protein [Endozoicomonas elysicola]
MNEDLTTAEPCGGLNHFLGHWERLHKEPSDTRGLIEIYISGTRGSVSHPLHQVRVTLHFQDPDNTLSSTIQAIGTQFNDWNHASDRPVVLGLNFYDNGYLGEMYIMVMPDNPKKMGLDWGARIPNSNQPGFYQTKVELNKVA